MRLRRLAVLTLVTALALLTAPAGRGARAQSATVPSDSNISAPFPEVDIYKVQVYGDTLAEGLQGGLIEALAGETRLQLQRKHRAVPGLLRGDAEEDAKAIEAEIAKEAPHIAVVMLGVNDRVPMRAPNGRRVNIGADEWRAEYGRRLDRLMRVFRRKAIAVYWVSLPIMRRQDITDDVQMMGGVMRERALVNSVRFVDVLASFAEADGSYNSYGPDVAGKNKLLRDQDGIHFTAAGYRKLAHFVEREIRRDMAQARAERVSPLAGGEEEQRRIRPIKVSAQAPGAKGPLQASAANRASVAARASGTEVSREGDIRADNSRVTIKSVDAKGKDEGQITLEILRPAIPASVVSVITRRESTEKASQVGDPVMTEILGGVTVVSSVTPSGEGPAAERRRQSPTNSLYYRVLVKGERIEPRPGRSDDMPWPRQETLPPPPAPVAGSPAPTPAVPPPPVRQPRNVRAAPRG